MGNKDHRNPTETYSKKSDNNAEQNKWKLKKYARDTTLSKRMNSESTDDDHTNEPITIRPLPLKYKIVSILPSHLKLTRKRKMSKWD